jgi:cephalosporin hydroxylase
MTLRVLQILYDVKPDLIIETGTNAGGSALWLSVLMEAINPDCKILTVDIQPLSLWIKRFGGELPTDKEPWKKRVTFMQMKSTSEKFLTVAKEMASKAKTVLVLLDRCV